MEPHVQAESYWSDLQQVRIQVLKRFTCRECEHCHSWRAKANGGSVPVGFCTMQEMPLDASELDSSQWDMCGEMLLDD